MRRLALFLLVGLAIAGPPADAYVLGGQAWPDASIGYHPGNGRPGRAIDRAARAWNRARVGVRFERRARSSADVVFRRDGRRCVGSAPLGYQGSFRTTVILGRGCNSGLLTLNAAHELGHVLGLDHERRRCAVMNARSDHTGTPSRCRSRPLAWWVKHPLRADDIRGARALYAGRASSGSR